MSYDEALTTYPRATRCTTRQSSETFLAARLSVSERTDTNDGWHFRNRNSWLATVYDDGTAGVFNDDPAAWDELHCHTSQAGN